MQALLLALVDTVRNSRSKTEETRSVFQNVGPAVALNMTAARDMSNLAGEHTSRRSPHMSMTLRRSHAGQAAARANRWRRVG
jgi:hypothetical protein